MSKKTFNKAAADLLPPELRKVFDAVIQAPDDPGAVNAYTVASDAYDQIFQSRMQAADSGMIETKRKLTEYLRDAEKLAVHIECNIDIGAYTGREGLKPLEDISGQLAQSLATFAEIVEESAAVPPLYEEAFAMAAAYDDAYGEVLLSITRMAKNKGDAGNNLKNCWEGAPSKKRFYRFYRDTSTRDSLAELSALTSPPPDVVARVTGLLEAVQDKHRSEKDLLVFREGLPHAVPATKPFTPKPPSR